MILIGGGVLLGCAAQYKSQKAPEFTVVDLQGKKLALADYKGNVVLLEFWATWCGPCLISMPEVEKIEAEYRGKKFKVLSLSLDTNAEDVLGFLSRHPLPYRVALATDEIQYRYGVRGIPAFYIIDKNGFVTRYWGGYHPSLPTLWRKEISQLLGS